MKPMVLSVNRQVIVNTKDEGKPIRDYDLHTFDLSDRDSVNDLLYVLTHHNHTNNIFEGQRKASNNKGVTGIMLDFDDGDVSMTELIDRFKDYVHIIHTTASHTALTPRFRVILPFEHIAFSDHSVDEFYRWCKARFADVDSSCFEAGRHFFPCCEPARDHFEWHVNADAPYFKVPVINTAQPTSQTSTTNWQPPILQDKQLRIMERAVDYLLSNGVNKGARDNEALLRASECRKIGIPKPECVQRMNVWNLLNTPPLGDTDLERIVNSAYDGRPYDFGTNNDSLRMAREWAQVQFEPQPTHVEESDPDATPVRRPRSLAELLKMDINLEMPEIVGRWFSLRACLSVLSGREKWSGKSTLCVAEVMAALSKGYKVLWLSHDENLATIMSRFMEFGADKYADKLMIAADFDAPSSWNDLANFMAEAKCDLCVIDSLDSVLNGIGVNVPENSSHTGWNAITTSLRKIASSLNIALVLVHHAKKEGGGHIGSIGITAGVDYVVELSGNEQTNSTSRTLKIAGRRLKVVHTIRYSADSHTYSDAGSSNSTLDNMADFGSTMQAALMNVMLSALNEDWHSITEIEKALLANGHTLELADVKKVLAEMHKQGVIDQNRIGGMLKYKRRNQDDITQQGKGSSTDLLKGSTDEQ